MSIRSILAFLGWGKKEVRATETEVPQERPATPQTAAVTRQRPAREDVPPRRPSPTPRGQQWPPTQQSNDNGTNLLIGAVLYGTMVNSQNNDGPPSPKDDFKEAQPSEPAHDHRSHDTGGISTHDYSPPADYSPPSYSPPADYGGGGGGYDGGGGGAFAPQML